MDEESLKQLLLIRPVPLPVFQGIILPSFQPFRDRGVEAIIKEINDFQSRPSDVLICGFPKSGNNWVREIIELLLNQKAELTDTTMPGLMLELGYHEWLNNIKNVRTIHTHLPYRVIASSKLIGQSRVVVIVRNPKDVCVSYYHHSRKDIFINYDIPWNEFF